MAPNQKPSPLASATARVCERCERESDVKPTDTRCPYCSSKWAEQVAQLATAEPGIERFDVKKVAARIVQSVVISGMSVAEIVTERELRALLDRIDTDHRAVLEQARRFMWHADTCASHDCATCRKGFSGRHEYKKSACDCGLDQFVAAYLGEETKG